MRMMFVILALMTLTSCGGGRVTGTIGSACMEAGRAAANPALCSCVQRAANARLSGAEQRRAAEFFADPQKAQDTRQSDNAGSERFWERYKDFAALARSMCG